MKHIVSVILIALLSVALCLFMPWWSIAIAAFVVALLIPQHPLRSFLSGFVALFILWGGLAFYISYNNQYVLAEKLSVLILKSDQHILLVLVTALIGAVVGALSALSGSLLRRLF